MAGDDDMMVRQRSSKEIPPALRDFHDYLGTAEAGLGLVSDDFARYGGQKFKIRGHLQDGDRARRQFALDGRTNPGLEMGVIAVGSHHIERNGAVREQKFVAFDT